jgi:hypothetical protein
MEKVISAGDHGITFNEMIAYLKEIGKDPKADFFDYYKVWFFRTFFIPRIHPSVDQSFEFHASTPGYLDQQMNLKAVLSAEASFDYMEYLELKEARESSKQAKQIAIAAIIISIILALIQILIPIIQSHCG